MSEGRASPSNSQQHADAPPVNNILAPVNGIVMPGLVAPANGIIAPANGIIAPANGIVAPPNGIVGPANGIVAPPNGIVAPVNGIVAPGPVNDAGAVAGPSGAKPRRNKEGDKSQKLAKKNSIARRKRRARIREAKERQEQLVLFWIRIIRHFLDNAAARAAKEAAANEAPSSQPKPPPGPTAATVAAPPQSAPANEPSEKPSKVAAPPAEPITPSTCAAAEPVLAPAVLKESQPEEPIFVATGRIEDIMAAPPATVIDVWAENEEEMEIEESAPMSYTDFFDTIPLLEDDPNELAMNEPNYNFGMPYENIGNFNWGVVYPF